MITILCAKVLIFQSTNPIFNMGSLSTLYNVLPFKFRMSPLEDIEAGCLLYLILGYDFMSSGYSFFMLGFIVISFLCYLLLYKTGIVKEDTKH